MAHKIATCNYCGTRAALVLDRARHELACASCGAPLHDMKALPKAKSDRTRPGGRPMTLPRQSYGGGPRAAPPPRNRKKKRRKGIGRRIFEELWDVVEDVFD
ncbi:MAG TPA: hypothetical protein VJ886_02265 [Roseovarius sp.]|nr:hypothetical protein [Roseovarius sp.]